MNIKNDIVTFSAEDFAGLSDFGKKAVAIYLEDYAAYFSAKVNREIELAKAHLKTLTVADPKTDALISGLASADETTLAQVEPLLAQLDALLNADAAEPEQPAEAVAEAEQPAEAIAEAEQPADAQAEAEQPEESLSLLDKVKSFFS